MFGEINLKNETSS